MSDDVKLDENGLEVFDDLDEFSMDVGDDDLDVGDPKSRTVIDRAATGAMDEFTNRKKQIAAAGKVVKATLPEGYGSAFDTLRGAKDDATRIYDKAVKQAEPTLSVLRGVGRSAEGLVTKLLPSGLAKRYSSIMAEPDNSPSREVVDPNTAEISRAMETIFKIERATDEVTGAKAELERDKDRAVETARFDKNQDSQSMMADGIGRLVGYQDTVLNSYYQKSLELQFKQYFSARELFTFTQANSIESLQQLKAVVLNTAMPNEVKVNNSEEWRRISKERFVGNIQDSVTKKLSNLTKNFKQNVSKELSEFISTMNDRAESVTDMADDDTMDVAEFAGSMAGSMGRDALGVALAKKLKGFIGQFDGVTANGERLQFTVDNWKRMFNRKASESAGDGVVDRIMELAGGPITRDGEVVLHNLADEPTANATWDNISRRTLIEIIPGFQSRQLEQLTNIANGTTGTTNDRVIYNTEREEFTKLSTATDDARLAFSKTIDDSAGVKAAEVVREIDEKGVLSDKAISDFGLQLTQDSQNISDFRPTYYADPTNINSREANDIANVVSKYFGVTNNEDGTLSESTDTTDINRKSKVAREFNRLTGNINNVDGVISRYAASGNKELLRETGYVTKADGDLRDSVDIEHKYSMARDAMDAQRKAYDLEHSNDNSAGENDTSIEDIPDNTPTTTPTIPVVPSEQESIDDSVVPSPDTTTINPEAIAVVAGLLGPLRQPGSMGTVNGMSIWDGDVGSDVIEGQLLAAESTEVSAPTVNTEPIFINSSDISTLATAVPTNNTNTPYHNSAVTDATEITSILEQHAIDNKMQLGEILHKMDGITIGIIDPELLAERLGSSLTNYKSKFGAALDWTGSKVEGAVSTGVGLAGNGLSRLRDGGKWLFPKAMELTGVSASLAGKGLGVAKDTAVKAFDYITGTDIYIKGYNGPQLLAARLKAGEYIDVNTGKVIKSLDDITGAVRDIDGIIITEEMWGDGSNVYSPTNPIRKIFGKALDRFKTLSSIKNAAISKVMSVAKIVTNKAISILSAARDVFIKDEMDSPVLFKTGFSSGVYSSKATGKVIESQVFIDGPVMTVDSGADEPYEILSAEQLRKGLVYADGEPVTFNTRAGLLADKAMSLAKIVKDRVINNIQMLRTAVKSVTGAVGKGLSHTANFLTGGKFGEAWDGFKSGLTNLQVKDPYVEQIYFLLADKFGVNRVNINDKRSSINGLVEPDDVNVLDSGNTKVSLDKPIKPAIDKVSSVIPKTGLTGSIAKSAIDKVSSVIPKTGLTGSIAKSAIDKVSSVIPKTGLTGSIAKYAMGKVKQSEGEKEIARAGSFTNLMRKTAPADDDAETNALLTEISGKLSAGNDIKKKEDGFLSGLDPMSILNKLMGGKLDKFKKLSGILGMFSGKDKDESSDDVDIKDVTDKIFGSDDNKDETSSRKDGKKRRRRNRSNRSTRSTSRSQRLKQGIIDKFNSVKRATSIFQSNDNEDDVDDLKELEVESNALLTEISSKLDGGGYGDDNVNTKRPRKGRKRKSSKQNTRNRKSKKRIRTKSRIKAPGKFGKLISMAQSAASLLPTTALGGINSFTGNIDSENADSTAGDTTNVVNNVLDIADTASTINMVRSVAAPLITTALESGIGSSAMAALTNPIGWGVLAAGALAYGGFKGYEYLSRRADLEPLEKIRYLQYGIPMGYKDAIVTIRYMEDKLSDKITIDKLGKPSIDLKDNEAFSMFHSEFNIPEDDLAMKNRWYYWFTNRYIPVYIKHLRVAQGLNVDILDIDDELDNRKKALFVTNIGFTDEHNVTGINPMTVMGSPWVGLELSDNIAYIDRLTRLITIASFKGEEAEIEGDIDTKSKPIVPQTLPKNLAAAKDKDISAARNSTQVVKQQEANTNKHRLTPAKLRPKPNQEPIKTGSKGSDLIIPSAGRISSPFGTRTHPIKGGKRMHKGVDIAAPTGTPVYASKSGVVKKAYRSKTYGNVIYMEHPDGRTTRYAHLSGFSNDVAALGQTWSSDYPVVQGELIGYVGSTGNSTGPHLHFEYRDNDGVGNNASVLNPLNYVASKELPNKKSEISPLETKTQIAKEEKANKEDFAPITPPSSNTVIAASNIKQAKRPEVNPISESTIKSVEQSTKADSVDKTTRPVINVNPANNDFTEIKSAMTDTSSETSNTINKQTTEIVTTNKLLEKLIVAVNDQSININNSVIGGGSTTPSPSKMIINLDR